ncbi:MAG: tetratricopeptide repeat protein [Chloroflexota bacterium]
MGQVDPSEIHAWLQQGVMAAKAGQNAQARQWLQKVLKADRNNATGWLWLSSVVDNEAHQIRCLQNVLSLDPQNKHAIAGLNKLQKKTSPPQNSIPNSQAFATPPQNTPIAAPSVTHTVDAVPAVQTKPSLSPDQCPFCQHTLSALDTKCSHCQIALTVPCPECETKTDVEHTHCATCGYFLGDCRDGEAYFRALLKAYEQFERFGAIPAMTHALHFFNPDDLSSKIHQGKAEAAQGRTEAAITTLTGILTSEPDSVEASLTLGQVYHQLHQWDDAHRVYDQALTVTPDSAELHYAKGWLLMEERQVPKAIKSFQTTLKLDPEHGWSWLRLGQIYDAQRRQKQATQAYKEALTFLPDTLFVYQQAQKRIDALNPELPEQITTGWVELIRRMLGPFLICLILALVDAGVTISDISAITWLMLILSIVGGFLWASGSSASRNPFIRALMDEQDLPPVAKTVLVWIGITCWVIALLIIVLPFGRTMPEVPLL